ncbi:MAG: Aminodeoxychorismate lyase [Steroidobacteraceae bacterium]|nr:Aminodeoxychorismate lyase [Steroidobacteraceae bacterium]
MLAAWVQGEPASSIGLDDRGLHYGDGLFETIGASGGRARFLGAHLARLARGCAALSIPAPDAALLAREVTRAAGLAPHVIIKVIVTRGALQERGYAWTGSESPTRIVCAWPWSEGPLAMRAPARTGLATRPAAPPLLPGIKHLNCLGQVLARQEARQRGLDEVILADPEGCIIGGGMTNLFVYTGDTLATPLAARCMVAGVMRAQVLAAAESAGFRACERAITAQELAGAEALWITNVRVGLWPVGGLGQRTYAAHPRTSILQHAIEQSACEAAGA